MQLRWSFCFLAITGMLCLVSCAKKQQTHEDPSLQAYRLIDENRTEEAISLLEAKLVEDPKNQKFKIVLASAYAHKAGIKVQKFVSLVSLAERTQKLTDKLNEKRESKSHSQRINNLALQASILLSRLASISETYASVPVIDQEQAVSLTHAIGILNEIGPELRSEEALYRAVLEIVLFKHLLAENFIGEISDAAQGGVCRVDLGKVNDTLVRLGRLMIDIFNDIGLSQPRQAAQMKKLAGETSEMVSNLTVVATSIVVLDEASQLFLRQSALQVGFGKLFQCAP